MKSHYFALWAIEAIRSDMVWPDDRFPPSYYYRFLRLLAAKFKPRLSVELGCGDCGASLHLAWGHQGGKVVGVDLVRRPNVDYVERHRPNFTFMLGDSVALAERINGEHGSVDILFIDTVHTYERTMLEFDAYRPYFSPKAIVCLDDLHRPGMDRAWEELPGRKVRLDLLHIGEKEGEHGDGGFGIIWNSMW